MRIRQGKLTEGKLLSAAPLLREAARLYYEEKLSQDEIAKRMGYSRQAIGKALKNAEERGIVRISVVPEQHGGYLQNLARDLRIRLGLQDLVLVPGHNLPSKEDNIAQDVLAAIAATAAEYLDALLSDKDRLAVSGGSNIMRHVVRYLKPTKLLPELEVVATTGFVESHTNYGDANLIAHEIATAYGARHFWLPIPAITENPDQCKDARALPLVREVLEKAENATVYMMGLWLPFESTFLSRQVLTNEQVEKMNLYRPVVNVNLWYFDKHGHCINEEAKAYSLTGFEIPKLKERIKNDNIKSILVAGAFHKYIDAIRAVLKAGIVNILITDHITAQTLLEPKNTD